MTIVMFHARSKWHQHFHFCHHRYQLLFFRRLTNTNIFHYYGLCCNYLEFCALHWWNVSRQISIYRSDNISRNLVSAIIFRPDITYTVSERQTGPRSKCCLWAITCAVWNSPSPSASGRTKQQREITPLAWRHTWTKRPTTCSRVCYYREYSFWGYCYNYLRII